MRIEEFLSENSPEVAEFWSEFLNFLTCIWSAVKSRCSPALTTMDGDEENGSLVLASSTFMTAMPSSDDFNLSYINPADLDLSTAQRTESEAALEALSEGYQENCISDICGSDSLPHRPNEEPSAEPPGVEMSQKESHQCAGYKNAPLRESYDADPRFDLDKAHRRKRKKITTNTVLVSKGRTRKQYRSGQHQSDCRPDPSQCTTHQPKSLARPPGLPRTPNDTVISQYLQERRIDHDASDTSLLCRLLASSGCCQSLLYFRDALASIRKSERMLLGPRTNDVAALFIQLDDLERVMAFNSLSRRLCLLRFVEIREEVESQVKDEARKVSGSKKIKSATEALNRLTREAYPTVSPPDQEHGPSTEYKKCRKSVANRLSAGRNWMTLRRSMSLGLLALISSGKTSKTNNQE